MVVGRERENLTMGRSPCCDKASVKRGPWSEEEDAILRSFVERFGNAGNWIALPHKAGARLHASAASFFLKTVCYARVLDEFVRGSMNSGQRLLSLATF